MTWKERKELENKKVVSLGGKVKNLHSLFITFDNFKNGVVQRPGSDQRVDHLNFLSVLVTVKRK